MSGFKHSRRLMEGSFYYATTRHVRFERLDLSRCKCLMVVIEYYRMYGTSRA